VLSVSVAGIGSGIMIVGLEEIAVVSGVAIGIEESEDGFAAM